MTKSIYDYTDSELAVALEIITRSTSFDDINIIDEVCSRLRKTEATEEITFVGELRNLFEKRGKIQAIKHHRTMTKVGLKDSKEAVEKLAEEGGWVLPPSRW